MVVRINCGRSIKGALHYNEQKVEQGTAQLILASRFACDTDDLTVEQKLARFKRLTDRNAKIETTCLHVSLNFASGEQLPVNILRHIAADYMHRIGFGEQPFLVYLHKDTAHQHLHIVSTNIRPNGKAISFHNLGKDRSEPARQAIEQIFNLVVAEGRRQSTGLKSILQPVNYGRAETKAAISNIVREVTTSYKYTSLEELDALLRQFNVTVDRGPIGSLTWQRGGLTYSICDREGGKVGVPIQASDIYSRPVLAELEKKMTANQATGIAKRSQIKRLLDKALDLSATRQPIVTLQQQGISCRAQTDVTGSVQDVFFIDNRSRAIISAKSIGYLPSLLHGQLWNAQELVLNSQLHKEMPVLSGHTGMAMTAALYGELTADTYSYGYIPPSFTNRKKKKKKRKP